MAGFCGHCRRRLGSWEACSCDASRAPAPGTAVAVLSARSTLHAKIDLASRVAARRRRYTLIVLSSIAVVLVGFGALIAVNRDASWVTAQPVAAERPTSIGSASGSGRSTASASRLMQDRRTTDRSALSGATGSWLPQISSKREGSVAEGVSWDAARIWQEFELAEQRYPDARLVWSDDWSSFRQGGYWVTVVDQRYSTAAQANAWCDAQGFAADQCYAKRLTHSGGFAGNTVSRG